MKAAELKQLREEAARRLASEPVRVLVDMGTDAIAAGAREVAASLREEIAKLSLTAAVVETGDRGLSYAEPVVEVRELGKEPVIYRNVTPELACRIAAEHLGEGRPLLEHVLAWESRHQAGGV